ncbi:S-layer homology domain-containing protein, partial [Butyricicoccus sp. 1XD8-22]
DSDQVYESFAESISLLNSLGIMNGKADGTFDPQGELTRGQMAKILTRTLKIGDLM